MVSGKKSQRRALAGLIRLSVGFTVIWLNGRLALAQFVFHYGAMVDKNAGIASIVKMVSNDNCACIRKAPLKAPRIPPKRPIPSIQATPVARPWVG